MCQTQAHTDKIVISKALYSKSGTQTIDTPNERENPETTRNKPSPHEKIVCERASQPSKAKNTRT